MTSVPVKKLRNDIIGSFLIGGVLFAILHIVNNPVTVLDNIGSFNSTTTTALGLIFTVLAIIYTFESQFENNKAINVLKEKGQYQDVTEVFVLSVATVGVIWIYTFALTITELYKPYGYNVKAVFSYLSIVGFVLLIERLRRCFWIFVLLNRALEAQK